VELLDCPVRGYAWGSRTVIAQLQGRAAPTAEPEAELWLGAHPGDPSALCRAGGQVPLTEVIAADPVGVLGADAVRRFGPRLPYLLKFLAAAAPLSLQAHPDAAQAAAGFAAETDAGPGNYVDPYHKPELLVAVGEFEALCGFRSPDASAELLAALEVAELEPTVDALRDPGRGLRAAVAGLLTVPAQRRAPLVDAVVAAARRRGAAYELVDRLARHYPQDVGVVVALLLNHVRLVRGEALWMPAGNIHAYLSGAGVEIMAASDNVLRGGLTPKRVDVPELLAVLRFEPLADPVVRPRRLGPGLVTWDTPAEEFVLHRAEPAQAPGAVTVPGSGPRIVLCLRGEVRVDDGAAAVTLTGGAAAFAPAGRPPLLVSGDGEAYQAGTVG
jgi:mannose-6-phosphate isomerase